MALRTKNAIRRSFIELLAERPFDKISVRDIAERSEVTRNTFIITTLTSTRWPRTCSSRRLKSYPSAWRAMNRGRRHF